MKSRLFATLLTVCLAGCVNALNQTPTREALAGESDGQLLARAKRRPSTMDELSAREAARDALIERRTGWPPAEKSNIRTGMIWIGMTAEQAILSRAEPEAINRDVRASGMSEQWIYRGGGEVTYLYFENGTLKSWQERG